MATRHIRGVELMPVKKSGKIVRIVEVMFVVILLFG